MKRIFFPLFVFGVSLLFLGCPSSTQVKKKQDPLPDLNKQQDNELSAQKGHELYADGRKNGKVDYAQIEKHYQTALSKDPEDQKTLFNLACLYEEKGDFQKASEMLGTLLRKNPKHEKALLRLAQVYVRSEQFDFAKRTLERYIQGSPKEKISLEARLNLASLQIHLGETEPALQTARSILAEDKENISAYRIIARVYYKQKHYRSVILLYDLVQDLKTKKEDAEFLYICALASFQLKKMAEGVVFLEKAVSTKPQLFQAQMRLGKIALEYHNGAKALVAFQEAVKSRPNEFNAKLYLALALRLSQKYTDAEKIYTQMIQAGDTSGKSLFNLGILQLKYLKNFQNARKSFRKYIGDMGAQISSEHVVYKYLKQAEQGIQVQEMMKKSAEPAKKTPAPVKKTTTPPQKPTK